MMLMLSSVWPFPSKFIFSRLSETTTIRKWPHLKQKSILALGKESLNTSVTHNYFISTIRNDFIVPPTLYTTFWYIFSPFYILHTGTSRWNILNIASYFHSYSDIVPPFVSLLTQIFFLAEHLFDILKIKNKHFEI